MRLGSRFGSRLTPGLPRLSLHSGHHPLLFELPLKSKWLQLGVYLAQYDILVYASGHFVANITYKGKQRVLHGPKLGHLHFENLLLSLHFLHAFLLLKHLAVTVGVQCIVLLYLYQALGYLLYDVGRLRFTWLLYLCLRLR